MHHNIKIAIFALLGATTSTVTAQSALEMPTTNDAMSSVVAVARANTLAGEFVITDANGATQAAVLGMADKARGAPHRRGQRWLWASVTKQVTAVLVMQEVERGRLELDAPAGRYLKTYADRTITLRQLLQHQSGLPNPSDTAPDGDGVQTFYRETGPSIGDNARAAGFCAGPAKRSPGGDFEYNNCDYQVLGAVLEAVTGQRYKRLIKQRIAQSLGLRSLRMAKDGAPSGGAEVTGYTAGKLYPSINIATAGAAGALTGSTQDLATLDRALMNGKLLSPASRAVLWSGNPKLGYQALGVWSFPAPIKACGKPLDLIERRGDFGGTQVRNIIAPSRGRALIIFTNDDAVDFGEVWQGKGLSYDLLAAAFCPSPK